MPTTTQNLPIAGLQMAVRRADPATRVADGAADAPATFELVFSTGAPVRRYDWANDRFYREELVVDAGAIDLSRLERGAPLLNSHMAWSLSDQIGVVRNPQIEGGRGTVQAQMSRREDVRGIVQDIADGVINNVSVGYVRNAVEMISPDASGAGEWVYRVTSWTPMEVSMVPIPADMDSQVVRSADGSSSITRTHGLSLRTYPCHITTLGRATTGRASAPILIPVNPAAGQAEHRNLKGRHVEDDETQAGGQPTAAPSNTPEQRTAAPVTTDDATRAAQAAVQAERQRARDIRAAADAARGTLGADVDPLAQRLLDDGASVDEARRQILDALAARSQASAVRGQAGHIQTTRDEVDTRRAAMADALVLRVNPRAQVDAERARQYRGLNMVDMARAAIEAAGGRSAGMSPREVALAALNCDSDSQRAAGMHSTSDLPIILGSAISRTLRADYEAAPRTFTAWANPSTNRDFRDKAVAQMSVQGALKKVLEGAEYQYVSLSEASESYRLSKYGAIVAYTWEAMVNDDLSALARIPRQLANKAAQLESDLVYAALLGTTPMRDGQPLFHASHNNLAGTGTAITEASLAAARAAMRKQTGPDGSVLNLTPSILLVGPDKEFEANKYTSAQFVATKAGDVNPNFNTSLTVVVDARITGNQWYLLAAPSAIDTVEYAYLEGEQGLFTERREGFHVDGVEIKVRHVFAAKALDWVGAYRNSGA